MRKLDIVIADPPGPGWVRLLSRGRRRAGVAVTMRGRDTELADWAVSTAHSILGPSPDPDLLAGQAEQLTNLTLDSRERGHDAELVLLPSPCSVPAAHLYAAVLPLPSGLRRAITLDNVERHLDQPRDTTREFDARRVELPDGPAVRTRRVEMLGDGDDPSEGIVAISYTMLPRAIRVPVTLSMYWVLVDDEPGLTRIADQAAETLRVTR